MRLYSIIGCALLFSVAHAQLAESERQAIIDEGNELYLLELASWNSSDLLSSIWGVSTLDSIEGYLSYNQGNSYNTIYYGGNNPSRIYAHFVFDSVSSLQSAIMDITPRNAARTENALIAMRTDALERVGKNEDGFFTLFEKTSFNLIPIIKGSVRKVVILTAAQEEGNVLFGNDYVLEYSPENKFLHARKENHAMSQAPMEVKENNRGEFISWHTHTEGEPEYITATDVCTLLLYGEYTNWDKHVVISGSVASVWDVRKRTLEIISRKACDKLYGKTE